MNNVNMKRFPASILRTSLSSHWGSLQSAVILVFPTLQCQSFRLDELQEDHRILKQKTPRAMRGTPYS